tara:strand:- start:4788 stop:5735 length:948 start_codon:yes stop_codon:yes gene_type:complete
MKISIVGPATPIPPVGWGAVESLIWDYKVNLERLSHEVDIININNPKEIIKRINDFKPDFVHIQYDDWIVLYPYIQYPCACTTHFAYLEQPQKMDAYSRIFGLFQDVKPNVFCLSDSIKKAYSILGGITDDRLFVVPNGVDLTKFRHTDNPEFPDRSIYLAKIDYRKRQHKFQSIDSLFFAGNIADKRFNENHNYLGEWKKEYLHDYLTDYGNLVLLSDGEAHSLVIMEAFAAGLGVVVSEFATANLDLDKEFITVVPEDKIDDPQYVEYLIKKNREYSVTHRDEILEYAKNFCWAKVIKDHYLPTVQKVIDNHG